MIQEELLFVIRQLGNSSAMHLPSTFCRSPIVCTARSQRQLPP